MRMTPGEKVLVLAPHIDDGEFGCGGFVNKLVQEGCEVRYVAFSDCANSILDGMPKDILRTELKQASAVLGLTSENVSVLNFEVRRFDASRQEILQYLVDLNKSFEPDLVLTPATSDIHQDHQVVTNECKRAFKTTTILGYELPWNCFSLAAEVVVKLQEKNIEKKVEAIHCYQSQSHRSYYNQEYIKSLAYTRGMRINTPQAEAFELIRLIIK